MTTNDILKLAALGAGVFAVKSVFGHLFEYDLRNKTG
jgi:hypothetical protein